MALSRCKTLEGLVLSTPIPTAGIQTDAAILQFDATVRENAPSQQQLLEAKISYQQQMLLNCFDFGLLGSRLNYLARLITDNARVVRVTGDRRHRPGPAIVQRTDPHRRREVQIPIGVVFLFIRSAQTNASVRERTAKASVWFQEQFDIVFSELLRNLEVETDNKELAKKIKRALDNLRLEITAKLAGIQSCREGFSLSGYLQAVSDSHLEFTSQKAKKPQTPEYGESDIDHPELFRQLKQWRARRAQEAGVANLPGAAPAGVDPDRGPPARQRCGLEENQGHR